MGGRAERHTCVVWGVDHGLVQTQSAHYGHTQFGLPSLSLVTSWPTACVIALQEMPGHAACSPTHTSICELAEQLLAHTAAASKMYTL
jgi:hypothetical protein